MKVFCVRCGTPKEVDPAAATAWLTCATCGHSFTAQPPAPAQKSSNAALFVMLVVVAVPVVIAVIGILAAIAIPNFIRFQARSKQAECMTNLKALYTAERSHFAEQNEFSTQIAEVGFAPERRNRYAYYLSAEGPLAKPGAPASSEATGVEVDLTAWPTAKASGGSLPRVLAGGSRLGVEGACPDCSFTAACVGNVDSDVAADVWSISSLARTGPDGEPISAGQPFNDVNDVVVY